MSAEVTDEALIWPALLKKETGRASDRAQIAGVFANRLPGGHAAATDPTVIYGLGRSLTATCAAVTCRPTRPGTPTPAPACRHTPIAMPGKAALLAAVQPALSRALYFVAKGDGSSHFSAGLDEHNRAVNRYQRGRSQ